jgi:hypothetical protein
MALPAGSGLATFGASYRLFQIHSSPTQHHTTERKASSMEAQDSGSGLGGLFSGVLGFVFAVGIYIFVCYCLKVICEKTGHEPGILIWIPIVQLIPLLQVAKMPLWYIVLFLIPLVNLIIGIMLWVKICQARGKSGWMVILMFIPLVNLAFLPYLAFSE